MSAHKNSELDQSRCEGEACDNFSRGAGLEFVEDKVKNNLSGPAHKNSTSINLYWQRARRMTILYWKVCGAAPIKVIPYGSIHQKRRRHIHIQKRVHSKRWNLALPWNLFPFICACTRIPFLYYFIDTWCRGDSPENTGRFSEIYNWHPTMSAWFILLMCWGISRERARWPGVGASCEQHFSAGPWARLAPLPVFGVVPKGFTAAAAPFTKNGMGKSNKDAPCGRKKHQKAPQ